MRSLRLLALCCISAAPLLAQRAPVVPAGTSVSPTLTPGITLGNLVFASGQLGVSREAGADTTIQAQTKRALESAKKVFEAAGTTMRNVGKCTVYLVDVKDFQGMNQSYREYFPDSPPARTTVVVAALVSAGAKVEIECVAVMP